MEKDKKDIAQDIAEAHVNWFLEIIRPLLIEHFVHGFKHGVNSTNPLNGTLEDENGNNE